MKTCKGCKWARWIRTGSGRLHPIGQGRCTFPIKAPVLPLAASHWEREAADTLSRASEGYIERNRELRDHCPCYAPEGSA